MSAFVIDGFAVEVVLDEVLDLHRFGSDGPREVVAVRIARRAHADVPIRIDHAMGNEDAVGRNEVFEVFHLFRLDSGFPDESRPARELALDALAQALRGAAGG